MIYCTHLPDTEGNTTKNSIDIIELELCLTSSLTLTQGHHIHFGFMNLTVNIKTIKLGLLSSHTQPFFLCFLFHTVICQCLSLGLFSLLPGFTALYHMV